MLRPTRSAERYRTHASSPSAIAISPSALEPTTITKGIRHAAITLSETQAEDDGSLRDVVLDPEHVSKLEDLSRAQSPPPQYPASEPSSSAPASPRPPPFSSLYTSTAEAVHAYKTAVTEAGASGTVPAYAPLAFESREPSTSSRDVVAETKAALPQDTKSESSKKDEESEPPPAYSEGSSPLESFTYLMAAAGGAASIITQVQQGDAQPINTLGGKKYHERV